jgi:hypothetical protein
MFAAQKSGNHAGFRSLKIKLDSLMEKEHKVKSSCREQKFAMRHDIETIHNCIDLIGYSGREAVDITERRVKETQRALDQGEIKPNIGNGIDHVFKIIAHAGKHSKQGAVLKYKIQSLIDDTSYECHKDMENGVFLVRMTKANQRGK